MFVVVYQDFMTGFGVSRDLFYVPSQRRMSRSAHTKAPLDVWSNTKNWIEI